MLVTDTQNVKRGQLKHALHSLDAINANVFGLVLNKIKTSGGRYGYAYGYGGYSYEYGSQGSGNGKRGARAAAKRGRGARKSGGSRRAR